MVKTFLLIFLIVFAVCGICEFVYILRMLFYFPGMRVKNYALIVLKSGYAVNQLNYIWQKNRWQGDSFAVGIIALTDNLETKEILSCNKFIKNKNIVLCDASSLSMCENIQGELF